MLLSTVTSALIAWVVVYIELNCISPPLPHSLCDSSSLPCLHPTHCFLSLCLSVIPTSPHSQTPPFSTNAVASLHPYTNPLPAPLPPPLFSYALCPAASESVLLQQLFQSKLTQTGSLVPAAQGYAGLRGARAALLLHKMPSASLVTGNTAPHQPRRYLDFTKVRWAIHRVLHARRDNEWHMQQICCTVAMINSHMHFSINGRCPFFLFLMLCRQLQSKYWLVWRIVLTGFSKPYI